MTSAENRSEPGSLSSSPAPPEGRVDVAIDRGIATVTLNRPAARNAMNTHMWTSLRDTFDALRQGDLRAAIVRGAGNTFCAGHDIKEMDGHTVDQVDDSFVLMEEALSAVEALPVPLIGVLHGVAAGGGCELLLACDIRVAACDARIGMPVARLGIAIGTRFTERLLRVVGPAAAKEIIFTAQLFSGSEACRMGLVNHALPAAEVDAYARHIAERAAQLSPTAIRHAKRMLSHFPPAEHTGYSAGHSIKSADEFREGVRSWMEKREPRF